MIYIEIFCCICLSYFPTCQINIKISIVLFLSTDFIRVTSLLPSLLPPTVNSRSQWELSGHCRTSTASSRYQWPLPDPNCELQISVATAGPQPRAPDLSGHCRAIAGPQPSSTASARSQWPLPDPNCELQISVATAGPQPRAPDISGHCRTPTASSRSQRPLPGPTASSRFEWALRTRSQWPGPNRELRYQLSLPDPNHELQISDASARSQSSTASSRYQWPLPDPNHELQISDASARSQSSTASSRYQWPLPDPNCELQISVATAGPQPRAPDLEATAGPQLRAPDLSGYCRTSTASARSQWPLPDPNCELQISAAIAGPQPPVPDLSGHWASTTSSRSQTRAPDLRRHCRTSTASSRSQWTSARCTRKNVIIDAR